MALCPNTANPAASIVEGLKLFDTIGVPDDFEGDYSVAGAGTRNFGNGVIKLKTIPPKTTIQDAWLIYNTYQSNNQPNPVVTLNGMGIGAPTLYGLCGSTCWFNPGPEAATYLRNRVYISNVTSIVKGNGDYTVTGLPVDLAMPIGTDGDRLPGCNCSQGAILYVVWEWNPDGGPIDKIPAAPNALGTRLRGIHAYLGAKLLSFNPSIWGGSTSYILPFEPVQSSVDNQFFKGNSNIVAVAGDTQNSLIGDNFSINQVRFVPPTNAFTPKIGPALTVKKYSVAQIYDGKNQAMAGTIGDCIDWFFFAISGDKTSPKADFQIVNCAATSLEGDIDAVQTELRVFSNYVNDAQTVKGGPCRAVKFNPEFVGPPAGNTPGMFPAATYYISIDKEIMKVVGKDTQGANGPPEAPDPVVWTVVRGEAGTTPTAHKNGTCIYLLAPPAFLKEMAAGLAPQGQPAQRPSPGRPQGRRRR